MIFVAKKPNGYVYIDLHKKKCFDTIRDVIAIAAPVEFKREYNSLESLILVPSAYYANLMSLIVAQPYAQVVIEVTDDYVADNIHKLAEVVNNQNSLKNTYKIVNTISHSEGATTFPSVIRGYILNKTSFNALLTAAALPVIP